MSPLDQAIADFRAAVTELEKRTRGRGVGIAVGQAAGSSFYPLKKTEAEIDAMSLSALESWVDAVEVSPPL